MVFDGNPTHFIPENQGVEGAKVYRSGVNVVLYELFLSCFLAFVEWKKYQRKNYPLKHVVVVNNKILKSKINNNSKIKWNQESSGHLKLLSTLQTHEITDHKLL